MIDPASLPDFNAADHLKTPVALEAFLDDFFAEGDHAQIAFALVIAIRAEKLPNANLLIDSIQDTDNISLPTVLKILEALGFQLTVRPKSK